MYLQGMLTNSAVSSSRARDLPPWAGGGGGGGGGGGTRAETCVSAHHPALHVVQVNAKSSPELAGAKPVL